MFKRGDTVAFVKYPSKKSKAGGTGVIKGFVLYATYASDEKEMYQLTTAETLFFEGIYYMRNSKNTWSRRTLLIEKFNKENAIEL